MASDASTPAAQASPTQGKAHRRLVKIPLGGQGVPLPLHCLHLWRREGTTLIIIEEYNQIAG